MKQKSADDNMNRTLAIYERLVSGEIINKARTATEFEVNEKTIQRDISDINDYFSEVLANTGEAKQIQYDRKLKGYVLNVNTSEKLSNSEILAVCKIILESRAFVKSELSPILDKMIKCCVPKENFLHVANMISNEKYHYIEPKHGIKITNLLWEISMAIKEQRLIEIKHTRLTDTEVKTRVIEPVGIMFSEYYFYLAAYIKDKKTDNPTIFRIDRIKDIKSLNEHFNIQYSDRFEEGEFRKRIQFMFSGELERIEFKYYGLSIEAILDRLPTAQIIKDDNGSYTVKAEVFGKGIKMWLLSQGKNVELIKPQSLVDEIKDDLKTMLKFYRG